MKSSAINVTGVFDDLRSSDLRFLEEVSKLGEVTIRLWSDELASIKLGTKPKLPLAERQYLLGAIRFVTVVCPAQNENEALPGRGDQKGVWAVRESAPERPSIESVCTTSRIQCHVFTDDALAGFPESKISTAKTQRKKVIVTGCYDWFHSGHVRFFEEVSAYGDLYVVVGHDANIRLLKGAGHPMFPAAERRYMVGSVRFVTQALISTGDGWLDAEPEIERIKPDIYAVNQDGDKGGKRAFCHAHGIEYLVLERTPAPGLPKRSSTDMRGF